MDCEVCSEHSGMKTQQKWIYGLLGTLLFVAGASWLDLGVHKSDAREIIIKQNAVMAQIKGDHSDIAELKQSMAVQRVQTQQIFEMVRENKKTLRAIEKKLN